MSSTVKQNERRKAKIRSPSLDARKERKREIDRRSQRTSRERTKAYIAKLEKENEELLNLSRQAGHVELTEKLKDQSDENERLRHSMRQISAIAMNLAGAEMTTSVQASSPRPLISEAEPRENDAVAESSNLAEISDLSTISCAAQSTSLINSILACGDGSRDYFSIANQAILFMEAACMGLPCPDPDEDEDIMLCAAFHGWAVANSKHVLDAGWQLLQLFDEGLFFRSGTVERVVTLRIMRAMSLIATRENVTERQKPPSYMEPTALQRTIAHARLADYYFWPSIRDLFVSTAITNVPESLSAQFASDIGFHWPFEVRDIALRKTITGGYKFSQEFNEAFSDSSNWYIKSERTAMYFRGGNNYVHDRALDPDSIGSANHTLLLCKTFERLSSEIEANASDIAFTDC